MDDNATLKIRKVLDIITQNPGIDDQKLRKEIATSFEMKEEERITILEYLNKNRFLSISQNIAGNLVYRYQDPAVEKYLQKLDEHERLVYKELERAAGLGRTKAQLRGRLRLDNSVVNAGLNKMLKAGLLKKLKFKDKTVYSYFLASVEPDLALVGGNFYQDGKLNTEMIQELSAKVLKFVAGREKTTEKEIIKFLNSESQEGSGLKQKDIHALLNALMLDKKIKNISEPSLPIFEHLGEKSIDSNIFETMPCFTCPVFDECQEGLVISPSNCIYLDQW